MLVCGDINRFDRYYRTNGLVTAIAFSTDLFAAGYTCDRVYTACNSGYYLSGGSCHECPSEYPLSDGGTGGINSCYLVTTPGMYVSAPGFGAVYCDAGHYCPGDVTVYYDGTGGSYACSPGQYSEANASACTNISANYYNTGCGTNDSGTVCSNDYSGGACAANATSTAGSS